MRARGRGPKLEKSPQMATAEHGLDALWDVLKKRGRTKRLAYQPALFSYTPEHPTGSISKTSPIHGYLIHYSSKADAPFAVMIGGFPGGETMVVAGSLDRFNRLTGEPSPSDLAKAKIVKRPFERLDKKRRDNAVADLAMTALTYGCFEPDIIQQIGSLAYKPGMAEV